MENRQYIRTQFSSRVKITFGEGDHLIANTTDVSDGGIFVTLDEQQRALFDENQLINVQVIDMPIEAPVVCMRVIRVMSSGIGLEFAKQ